MSVPFRVITTDDLTADEARALTQEIRGDVAELELKLVRAYQGRAWLALGYESWDDYVAGEFKAAPLALPREERRAAVQSLRGWGLSTRAIASATDVDHSTVVRDSQVVQNAPPDDLDDEGVDLAPVTGLDGKTYPTPSKPKAGPVAPDPAPIKSTCPTCGGTGKVTR